MARIFAAIAAGAVVYYVWGMLAWMALPLHSASIHKLPDEPALLQAVRGQDLETGVYVVPYASDPAEMSDPESEFMKNHQAGPLFSIYLRKAGSEPMGAGVLIMGLVIDVLASALAVCMLLGLGGCARNYWCRVGFVAGLGFFVAIVGHLSYWNWMTFPWDYTLAFMVDVVVGWTLAGLAIAALVTPETGCFGSAPTQHEGASTDAGEASSSAVQEAPAQPIPAKAADPERNDAIGLLAALQREARFIDIVQEPLGDYSDAQIGAAARDVLKDCGAVVERMFKIQPIVQAEDGSSVPLGDNPLRSKIKVIGNATDEAQAGVLVHHGWEAQQCDLPTWTGSQEMVLVIAPAEVEVK